MLRLNLEDTMIEFYNVFEETLIENELHDEVGNNEGANLLEEETAH